MSTEKLVDYTGGLKKAFKYCLFSTSEAIDSGLFDTNDKTEVESILLCQRTLWGRKDWDTDRGVKEWKWRFLRINDLWWPWFMLFGHQEMTTREVANQLTVPLKESADIQCVLYDTVDYISADSVNVRLTNIHYDSNRLRPYDPNFAFRLDRTFREGVSYWSLVQVPTDRDQGYPVLRRLLEIWEDTFGERVVTISMLEDSSSLHVYFWDWRGQLKILDYLNSVHGISVGGRALRRYDSDTWHLIRDNTVPDSAPKETEVRSSDSDFDCYSLLGKLV